MTTSTTRSELIRLAQEREIPGTREIITAINEAQQQLDLAVHQLLVRAQSADFFKRQKGHQVAGSFAKEANDHDVAAAKLNTLFLTLACVLQNNGVTIDY